METGKDKVKKICDAIRRETLDPSLREAEQIVEEAKKHAQRIVQAAHLEARGIQEKAAQELERQKAIFQTALSQASRQALETLRQWIEEKFFHQELSHLITRQTQEPRVIVDLIEAVIKGIEKEGIDVALSVFVPAAVSAAAVNRLLSQEMVKKLKEKSVLVGPLTGGIQVKLHQENVTLDLSDQALQTLVEGYVRKEFRETLFR